MAGKKRRASGARKTDGDADEKPITFGDVKRHGAVIGVAVCGVLAWAEARFQISTLKEDQKRHLEQHNDPYKWAAHPGLNDAGLHYASLETPEERAMALRAFCDREEPDSFNCTLLVRLCEQYRDAGVAACRAKQSDAGIIPKQ